MSDEKERVELELPPEVNAEEAMPFAFGRIELEGYWGYRFPMPPTSQYPRVERAMVMKQRVMHPPYVVMEDRPAELVDRHGLHIALVRGNGMYLDYGASHQEHAITVPEEWVDEFLDAMHQVWLERRKGDNVERRVGHLR